MSGCLDCGHERAKHFADGPCTHREMPNNFRNVRCVCPEFKPLRIEADSLRALANDWLRSAHEMMEPGDCPPMRQRAEELERCANELLEKIR